MKNIPVGKTHFALVDDEDYDDLIQFKWALARTNSVSVLYARRTFWSNGKTFGELMHKRITGFSQTDHINKNGLDNQRHNLRRCDHTQNNANKNKQLGQYTSQYKGVTKPKSSKKWIARIKVNGKLISLGRFDIEEDAAKAYDAAAVKYFGEFASINFKE